jgi:hypothetical protein
MLGGSKICVIFPDEISVSVKPGVDCVCVPIGLALFLAFLTLTAQIRPFYSVLFSSLLKYKLHKSFFLPSQPPKTKLKLTKQHYQQKNSNPHPPANFQHKPGGIS